MNDNEARDRAAREHEAMEYCKSHGVSPASLRFNAYIAGWDAKAAHDAEKLQKLVDALRFYRDCDKALKEWEK